MASEFKLISHEGKAAQAVCSDAGRMKGRLLKLSVHATNNVLLLISPFDSIIFKETVWPLKPCNEVWKICFQFLDRHLS